MRGWRRALEQRDQLAGQQVAGQVVDREAQLVAVLALLALATAGHSAADAGVVDQDVEALLAV